MKKIKRKNEWFDDVFLWRETYPFIFPDARFAGTEEEIDKVLTLTSPQGKTALDLCCGPGRCSIALAKRGFAVTGVDLTKYLLDKARAKAKAAGVRVKWVLEDMRDFLIEDRFDLALSMYSSIGYFEDRQEDWGVLNNLFTSLRPGGVCLIEVMGRESLARIFQATSSTKLANGSVMVERREVFEDWTRIRNEWIIIRNGEATRFTFPLNIYSGQELKLQMKNVGFADVTLYGSLDGEAYGTNSRRLIAVGRKRG